MTIQRYSINECASTGMDHNPDGDYVLFEDHDDALADAQFDYKELEKKYYKIVEKLGELYREG